MSLVIYLFQLLNLEYIVIGIETALEGKNNSFNVRIENILQAYERFTQAPLFGWGPAKMIHSTIIDSELALIMQRYGILGFISFGLFYVYLYRRAFILRRYKNLFADLTIVMGLIFMVVMFTNNVFSGYQLMSIFILLIIVNNVLIKGNQIV